MAWWSRPLNTAALVEAMTRIDDEAGQRQHLAAGARATISRTWTDYSCDMLLAWDRLIARRSRWRDA